MASIRDNKLRILGLLKENLENPQPQVVAINTIANRLHLSLEETRQLLLHMDEQGIIKSDMDAHFSLITPQGLSLLYSMKPQAAA